MSIPYSHQKEKQIVREFEQLRQQVHAEGLMLPQPAFYVRKVGEVFTLLGLAFWLQYCTHYLLSAMVLALTWQQLGWQVQNAIWSNLGSFEQALPRVLSPPAEQKSPFQ